MLDSQVNTPHRNMLGNNFLGENKNLIDLAKCKIHRQSHTIKSGALKCQCCDYPQQKHLKIKNHSNLNICFPLSVLSYLGPGTILYFAYIKLAVILMAVGCLFSIPMLIINALGSGCRSIPNIDCEDSFFVIISVVNLFDDPQKILIQTYLLSGVIIIMIVFSILGRKKMRLTREDQRNIIFDNISLKQQEFEQEIKMTQKHRYQQKRVEKYAIMVKDKKGLLNFQILKNLIRYWWELEQENFREKAVNQKRSNDKIKGEYCMELGQISQKKSIFTPKINKNQGQPFQFANTPLSFAPKIQFPQQNYLMGMVNPIESTIYCFNIETFNQFKEEFEQIQKQLKTLKTMNDSDIHKNMTRIQLIRDIIQDQKLQTTNKGIVIFRHPLICKLFMSRFRQSKFPDCNNFFQCFSNKTTSKTRRQTQMNSRLIQFESYEFEEAPLPSQIIWKNHHRSSNHKLCQRVFIWLAFFFLLALGQGILVGILAIWFNYLKGNEQNISDYFSTIVALAISLINVILYQLFFLLTKYQWYPNTSKLHISRSYKIIMITFLNSGLLLLCAYLIFDFQSIWVYGGFIDTLSYSFLYSVIMPHLAKYLNMRFIRYFYYRLKFQYLSNKQQTSQRDLDQCQRKLFYSKQINQKQANQISEKPIEYPQFQYSYICMTMLWASFFAPIIPIAFPLTFLSFCIHYWLQKINLLYLLSQPRPSSGVLNQHMLGVMEKAPFFMAAGNLVVQVIIVATKRNGDNDFTLPMIINSVVLVFTLYSFFLPSEAFNRLITCESKQKSEVLQEIISMNKQERVQLYSNLQDTFYTTYQNQSPVHSFKKKVKILFTRNISKMSTFSRRHNKSLKVIQQLNTMSKSLQSTLKDRLFNKDLLSTSKIYQTMLKAEQGDQSSFQYEYEQKVQMPTGKTKRADIPILFRPEPRSMLTEQINSIQIQKSNDLSRSKVCSKRRLSQLEIVEQVSMIPINKLFNKDEANDLKMKELFKTKIKDSIQKFR